MQKLKTLLILLLTLGLAVLLSTAALADDATSGTCGENVTWSLNTDTGVLTISGSGDMKNYYGVDPPWDSFKDSITAAVIEDGVTSIGSFAFSWDCSSLTSVTIPNSVTTIGSYAF
ncbi:MAG: leucine-rich repeat domain-containing protein [Oscillospiraceae bacterium]|nr:leucine-rich repeat domain-containing protein [Oscillospiraceae bacterium]